MHLRQTLLRVPLFLSLLSSLSCSGLRTSSFSSSLRNPSSPFQESEESNHGILPSWDSHFSDESSIDSESDFHEVRRGTTSSQTWTFDWPVDAAKFSRGFNIQTRRPHLGIDLASPKGTPIFSAHQGHVLYAGRDFRGYGNLIILESSEGWATLYAHLDKILVHEGQDLRQGTLIGRMGRTGRASGVHLHFELRKDKQPIDPIPYLPGGKEILSAHSESSLYSRGS